MPQLEEAINELEKGSKKSVADILDSRFDQHMAKPLEEKMAKMVEELIVDVFSDKIDEIIAEKVEEEVVSLLKVLRGPEGKPGKAPIKGVDFLTPQEVEQIRNEVTPQKDVHFRDGVDGKQGSKGFTGERGLSGKDGINGRDGKGGSPDIAIQVRDKLTSLKGEERLDAKAIKGLDKLKAGITRHRGGVGFNFEQPTGAVNGVNTVFTLTAPPKLNKLILFVNGLGYSNIITDDLTVSGSEITLVTAPPTGSNIFCLFIKK